MRLTFLVTLSFLDEVWRITAGVCDQVTDSLVLFMGRDAPSTYGSSYVITSSLELALWVAQFQPQSSSYGWNMPNGRSLENALDKSDRKIFDQMFNSAHIHNYARFLIFFYRN